MSSSTNINKVYFNGKTSAYAERVLYQWDYGQILQFPDLELPAAYQVHFSTAPTAGSAYNMLGTADGVSIPDTLLEEGKPIYAWIFLHAGEDDGETVRVAVIYVKPRSRATSETPTPAQQSAWDEAISALSAALEEAQALAEAIPEEIDSALAAAKASGEFDGKDGTRSWWTNSRVISAAAYESDGGVATIQLHSVDGATPAVGDYVYAPEVGQSGAPTALYVITRTSPVLTVFDRICSIKGDGGSGTGDYDDLTNKPQIAGVTLSGDKSLSDLGVAPKPMLVTLSHTGSGDTYTADKTYAEITDAIAAGREVLVDWGASILRPSALGATWIGYDDSQILEFILHSDSSWTGIITDLGSYRTAADQDTIDRQQNTAIEAKYTKPGTGIPKTDMAEDVQTSLGKAETALQSAPVTSVNGQTGAVTVPEPFFVTYSTNDMTTWTCDKTFAQITAAIAAGKQVVMLLSVAGTPFGQASSFLNFPTEIQVWVRLGSNTRYQISHSDDNTVSVDEFTENASWIEAVADNQGVSHAGEFLVVGSNGYVTTMTLSTWSAGSY